MILTLCLKVALGDSFQLQSEASQKERVSERNKGHREVPGIEEESTESINLTYRREAG